MAEIEEYIVTLKNFDDLEEFYSDMETPGGNLYIPDRAVVVSHKRPISRNTHYMLTAAEAEEIKKDPRVLAVGAVKLMGVTVPTWTTTPRTYSKSMTLDTVNPTYNWGLKRCIDGGNTTDWYPAIPGTRPAGANENVSSSLSTELSGKNVDVIIMDGHFDHNHPTFSVNSDGTGGSRVNRFNWYSLNSLVQPSDGTVTTYDYTLYDVNANHGAHVAGIAVGNENGWARDANIYNLNPYGLLPTAQTYKWDYIRAFHTSKPINPVTGLKNPTICNCSFGLGNTFPYGDNFGPITQVMYRGTLIGDGINPLTNQQYAEVGLKAAMFGGAQFISLYDVSEAADLLDAVADGVIFVTAAGNDSAKLDIPGGEDYDNYIKATVYGSLQQYYMNRGCPHAAFPGAICVGGVNSYSYSSIPPLGLIFTDNENIMRMSNVGPAVTLFAPGYEIVSAGNLAQPVYANFSCPSPHNALYRNMRMSGTSQASPQVCGVLACILERYPRFTQADALEYIVKHAKPNQITQVPAITYTDYPYREDSEDLQGAPNLYLYMPRERPSNGNVFPKINFRLRPTTGKLYPRVKIMVNK